MSDVRVEDHPEQSRYEARVGDELAGFADYRSAGGVVDLVHTEVDDAFGGQGVGSALARFALDDVRRSGRSVRPSCWFIAGWIERHPDYADLVA